VPPVLRAAGKPSQRLMSCSSSEHKGEPFSTRVPPLVAALTEAMGIGTP
jgi:hypothetical protein